MVGANFILYSLYLEKKQKAVIWHWQQQQRCPDFDVSLMKDEAAKYILSYDVGTTTIRAFVYDHKGNTLGTGVAKVKRLIFPKQLISNES